MSYLARMPDAVPVLQIIHVSDLHVVATKRAAAGAVRNVERWLKRVGLNGLWRTIRDGTAPHDPFAPIVFRRFVEQITVKDPTWGRVPAWLVDTGDQTTYGDDPSFARARQELASFAASSGPGAGSLVNLHGNHDAWPDALPILAPRRIPAHTAAMAGPPHNYAVRTSQAPLRAPLPSGNGSEIRLFTLDTVDDGFWANFWARGFVEDAQLTQLHGHLRGTQPGSGPHLRILTTHHPVHFPPPRPGYEMVIANEGRVGKRLDVPPPSVHLVLSGHTHALFPEHGRLPGSPRACSHAPLGTDQCQLVVGTLMQVDRFQKRGDHPHQCQVLRFHQDPAKPDLVILERLLAARNPYAKQPRFDYEFVPVANSGGLAEEMLFAL